MADTITLAVKGITTDLFVDGNSQRISYRNLHATIIWERYSYYQPVANCPLVMRNKITNYLNQGFENTLLSNLNDQNPSYSFSSFTTATTGTQISTNYTSLFTYNENQTNEFVFYKNLSIPAPTKDTHAITKAFADANYTNKSYVDTSIINFVTCVSTANIASISTVTITTIDGYTLQTGDLFLLVAQTTVTENGVYTYKAGASTKFVTQPKQAYVINGTINASKRYTNKIGTTWIDDNSTVSSGSSPSGVILAFAGVTIPTGWLACDGNAYSRTGIYATLFAAIGTSWGDGTQVYNSSGSIVSSGNAAGTAFNVPDLRGTMCRGVSGVVNDDPDRASRIARFSGGATGNNVGSYQTDSVVSHLHPLADGTWIGTRGYGLGNVSNGTTAGPWSSTNYNVLMSNITTGNTGSNETRSKNAYVNYIIKI